MKRSSQFFQCSTPRCAAAFHQMPCSVQIGSPAVCLCSLAPCPAHEMMQVIALHMRHPHL